MNAVLLLVFKVLDLFAGGAHVRAEVTPGLDAPRLGPRSFAAASRDQTSTVSAALGAGTDIRMREVENVRRHGTAGRRPAAVMSLRCSIIGFVCLLSAPGCTGINAWALPDGIVVTNELVEFTENHTELAFVILHEAGHITLGHLGEMTSTEHAEWEADMFALRSLESFDHDPCLVPPFLERLHLPARANAMRKALDGCTADVLGIGSVEPEGPSDVHIGFRVQSHLPKPSLHAYLPSRMRSTSSTPRSTP